MSITNPFAKSPTPTPTPFQSQNSPNNISSNVPKNLPPSKSQIQNQQNSQSYSHPAPTPNYPYQTPTNNNNVFNNQTADEEYLKLKSDYETKIKPLNCSPENISTTTSLFPKDYKTYQELAIPLSISISPMKNADKEIPFINFGDKNIPRCPNRNCRAYMNPFVKFVEGGDKWICNFCCQINNTEDFYYSDVDKNGIRLDIKERPELCNGSYEFYANKFYWKKGKNPTEALFIFVFETSMGGVNSGFFSACLEGVKDVINNENFYNGNKVKIGIITYNQGVDFYAYNKKFTQPQMMSINDEQVFLPSERNNLLFNLDEDKDKILQTLDLIQNTFNKNNANMPNIHCKDSVQIFQAIMGGYLLGKNYGGKIIIFSSSNVLNSIPKMNTGLDQNMTKEQIAYSAHDKRKLGNMGINLTNENMSVDIFATADTQINTFTLNQICEYSNGHFYFYKKFKFELHYKTIFNQIRRVLSRPICWESVNRTRFSSGYKISSFSTPCLVTNVDLFIFPTGDSDQNFLFSIAPPPPTPTEDESESKKNNNDILLNNYDYDDKNKYIFIQSALLYSYGDGSRRIRVHNLCLPISDNIKNIYSEINSEMLATFYLKDTIDKLYKTKNIANSIISTDTKFKLFIDKVMSTQNKIDKELLPNLDYLPYYMLGMFKHRIFCKDEIEKNYDIDISNFLRISLQKFSTSEIISYIVPSIYSLQEMEVDKSIGTYNNETGEFAMPNLISLSRSAMEDNGLYLIDNGYLLIIYVKKDVSSNIFQSLFGVENIKFLTMITNEENVFEENDGNELKERIKNILDYIRSSKSIFQNLVFVFEGDGGERLINECLIEDNFCKWFPMDYATFYKKYIKGNNSFGY